MSGGREEALTVAQAIELLSRYPEDARVFVPCSDHYYSGYLYGVDILSDAKGYELQRHKTDGEVEDGDEGKVVILWATGYKTIVGWGQ